MENGQPHYSANKLKVIQVLWVYPRVRVDLQRIIVMCRVLKETIKWIEHLVRKKEEKLPAFQLEGGRERRDAGITWKVLHSLVRPLHQT